MNQNRIVECYNVFWLSTASQSSKVFLTDECFDKTKTKNNKNKWKPICEIMHNN